ncbi:hypothetical protein ABZ464_22605 [Streptomyces sp. NPDC005820]|uniref:hypothetical protein n=1 Tax=Streptomyces sp. NPDC005820 TaxID=3157069 RepID=UPI0033FA2535
MIATTFLLLWTLGRVGVDYPPNDKQSKWNVDDHTFGGFQHIRNAMVRVFDGLSQVITLKDTGAPMSVRLWCLALLIFLIFLLRRTFLAHFAAQPGPVDVQRLVDATPDNIPKPLIEDLTVKLRKHISETDLYPPTALPAEPAASSFLDLLGDINLESGKMGTSLLRLFSRLQPKIAYRVTGVLQHSANDKERCCGVTVTITAYATRGSCAHTTWEATWEEAVHEAGNWIMAAILPVTRACKMPPWQSWAGRRIEPELFAAYQKGQKLSRERKFDEALDEFYKAVRQDPTNLYLRTQIGAVQEKLGLYIDALETYHGALTLGNLSTDQEDERLWWRSRVLRAIYLRHWTGRPGTLLTRYRYTAILGTSEKTADQWCHTPDDKTHPRRANARNEIRQALTTPLAERYKRTIAEVSGFIEAVDTEPKEIENEYGTPITNVKGARRWMINKLEVAGRKEKPYVQLIFQLACLQEVDRLLRDYSLATFYPGMRRERKLFTRPALQITWSVWAPLRLAWVADQLSRKNDKGLPALPGRSLTPETRPLRYWVRGGRKWPRSKDSWVPEDLFKRVKQARTRHIFERHAGWQEHYNAACVYAVSMEAQHDHRRTEFARLAFRELEDAVRCAAAGGSITLRRSWLLAEDPDLAQLREKDQYARLARFEREAYPRPTPDRRRFGEPRPIHIEMCMSNSQLLRNLALAMERTWHKRRSHVIVDVHEAITWFEYEKTAWEQLLNIASSQARNWPDRERLIQTVRNIADPELMIDVPPRVPEFNDIVDKEEGWCDPTKARDLINLLDGQLTRIGELAAGKNHLPSPVRRSSDWIRFAKAADAAGGLVMDRVMVQTICDRYAATWQTLRDVLDLNDASDHGEALRFFIKALRQLPAPKNQG